MKPLLEGEARPLPKRGLDLETCQKYRYHVGRWRGRPCQIAAYCDETGTPVAQKVRFPDKTFTWVGEPKRALLFGQQLWSAGGKRVVVTEGEIDALSLSQVQGNRWPVVSVPNGAQGAAKDLRKHLEWLESFETVVLMFDSDEPGQKAAARTAELFTPGKVRIAQLPLKDANDMLTSGRTKELVSAMWQAAVYRPEGVVSGEELWQAIRAEPPKGVPYPWECLEPYLYGQRGGEIVTWTGGTGTGKSQFLREVVHDLVKRGESVGVVALEDSVRNAAEAQLSLDLNVPLHFPDRRAEVTEAQLRTAFNRTLGTGRIFFYDHFGSVEPDVLLPKIRYMAVGLGCQWVILDHLSIMVSGTATEGDERKRIDEIMTRLRTMTENLGFGLHVIVHLRKASGTPFEEGGAVSLDDLRGSGAIKQVSDAVIALERHQQDETQRHITRLRVLKNRKFGRAGVAGSVVYDEDTGRLTQAPDEAPAFEDQTAAASEENTDF